MNILEKFLNLNNTNRRISIGVVGDSMIDQYFNVHVKRISPEFPIPIMHSDNDKSENFPGGASNVAYQFKHFNCDVKLISFLDRESQSVLICKGIDTSLCSVIKNKIPRKRRFYSEDFPVYRWDLEQENYGLGKDLEKFCCDLYDKAENYISNFDVLIFSDYSKGIFSNHLYKLISKAKISIVDPKSGDLERWKGCTIFKPNKQEALTLSGCSTVKDAGIYLLDKIKCKAVVITQAGDGVTVFDESGFVEFKPENKLNPAESVIGAGDCFSAFLAMAMARGMSIRESALLAWNAGVIYVKSKHNKPLCKNDFSPKILRNFDFSSRDYKLVFTNGCFDILHVGHIETLKFAKSLGDKLIVAVNSDESVSRIKSGRPIVSLENRMKLLESLEFVDFVVPFNEDTPLNLIKEIMPDVLVKGSEYKVESIAGYDIVPKIVLAPMVNNLSTTDIINKIKSI